MTNFLKALTLTQARKWQAGLISIEEILPAGLAHHGYDLALEVKRAFLRMLECASICEPPSEEGGNVKEWTWADQSKMDARTGRNLPVIIDAPGWYLTRRGHRVEIESVVNEKATFCCSGTIHVPPQGKRTKVKLEWFTWQPNGRFRALDEHQKDIVQKVE